jgi:hypothetical protein
MPVDVSGEPVVLLRSRIWPAVLVPAAMLAGSVAYGVWARQLPCDLLTIFAAIWLGSAIVFRSNAVLADDVGLLLRHRGRLIRSYRWDQIREAGLGYGNASGWHGITVFPDGGPYDVPGPNSPTVVGRIFLWRTGRGVRERIEAVLRQNGIPVIDDRGRRVPNGHQGPRPR